MTLDELQAAAAKWPRLEQSKRRSMLHAPTREHAEHLIRQWLGYAALMANEHKLSLDLIAVDLDKEARGGI